MLYKVCYKPSFKPSFFWLACKASLKRTWAGLLSCVSGTLITTLCPVYDIIQLKGRKNNKLEDLELSKLLAQGDYLFMTSLFGTMVTYLLLHQWDIKYVTE